MPSSEETFQRIQREISEVVQREKELRNKYARSQSASAILDNGPISPTEKSNGHAFNLEQNSGESHSDTNKMNKQNTTNGTRTTFERAHSVASINGNKIESNRLFKPNTAAKGVMHRFIKSRGKVQALTPSQNSTQGSATVWTSPDVFEPAKVSIQSGKPPRNGFVPIQERIRKEFEEMQVREYELRTERRKSQPNLMALIDRESSPPPERSSLRSAKSFNYLNDLDDYDTSAPSSLKSARSLAELCDANEEDLQTPSNLIRQWESIIQKNQQMRT